MSFSTHRYLLMTTDPVHIGTGGTRLGRVDLSIAREPGTRLPKIPGTSFSGAIRSYAAYRYGKRRCAGQGQPRDGREGHCGQPTCPICYTFGFVKGEQGGQQAHSGVVSIGDARLLLFPVYSMAGPVWVTSPSALEDFGVTGQSVAGGKARWRDITDQNHLNLGWLMVEKEDELSLNGLPEAIPKQVRDRIVLISDALFSQVVNSNLEVRTSVSISPETGAAEEGALFTYEAIPRATFLWIDVVEDDYRDEFPDKRRLEEWQQILQGKDQQKQKDLLKRWRLWQESDGDPKLVQAVQKALSWIKADLKRYGSQTLPKPNVGWKQSDDRDTPARVVTAGLEWTEHLGIGGMGTRGFGRIRKIAEVQP